ncbi:RNA polymerase sigma factor [Aeromicrobium choanae]|uniref:RNA polymerase sigma-70 factor, ECF subfamily n=1 Tax=Aeromicrobium choanae TaxID=1736691 RepID=A0A1T4Z822_9ACTN|nr:DUF6596 domain-containing protein [Aeromicrobium choanae]SKB09761.1 RNA polymerase sigma-70 factor, ECF subfamily [Aeromicrobium choanae]
MTSQISMILPLPPELRSARLSALSSIAVHLRDLGAARDAVDQALADPDSAHDLVASTARIAGLAPPDEAQTGDHVLTTLAACCHPALPEAARIALMLTTAAGLPITETAGAFSVPDETMTQRITWAENRARGALGTAIAEREAQSHLGRVLDVLLLIFDDGIVHPNYSVDLPHEALETTRAVVQLFPDQQEPKALLALMLLTRARRDARLDSDGSLKALARQDRDLWRQDEIQEGLFLLRGSQRDGRTGPYQIRASIQAAHVTAHEAKDTDWNRLLALHDRLMQVSPSDTVALGRACAVAEVHGPETALEGVERLGLDSHLYHATRAELLRRLDRAEEADRAWSAAVARARGVTEHQRLRGALER